jgi:hypothetical protein
MVEFDDAVRRGRGAGINQGAAAETGAEEKVSARASGTGGADVADGVDAHGAVVKEQSAGERVVRIGEGRGIGVGSGNLK